MTSSTAKAKFMADDDSESGSFPVEKTHDSEQEKAPSTSGQKHKVIADIHTGMVMVAPVATPLDLDDEDDSQEDDSNSPSGMSADKDGTPPKPVN